MHGWIGVFRAADPEWVRWIGSQSWIVDVIRIHGTWITGHNAWMRVYVGFQSLPLIVNSPVLIRSGTGSPPR